MRVFNHPGRTMFAVDSDHLDVEVGLLGSGVFFMEFMVACLSTCCSLGAMCEAG